MSTDTGDAPRDLDAHRILAAFTAAGAKVVVVGAWAAEQQGVALATQDIDLTPLTTVENMQRVSTALTAPDARIRVDDLPEGLAFRHDGESLAQLMAVNLTTRYGDVDLVMRPAGTDGYNDLIRDAIPLTLNDVTVPVASLDDVIRSKTAAGRPKDIAVLPLLIAASQAKPATPPRTPSGLPVPSRT